jgi:HSP20 family protein
MEDRPNQSSGVSKQGRENAQQTADDTYLTPAVDIYETGRAIVILADMPGVAPESLDIDISEGILSLAGRVEAEEAGGRDVSREYSTGEYSRSFRVTNAVNWGNVKACMKDGVLKVVLPKAKKAVARKIPIVTQAAE